LDAANKKLADAKQRLKATQSREETASRWISKPQAQVDKAAELVKLLQEYGAKENCPIVTNEVEENNHDSGKLTTQRKILKFGGLVLMASLLWQMLTPKE
jgi:hypothetical protein